MKVRESGMPDERMWESFFKPHELLGIMGVDGAIADLAEFGCGYGTFTLPAAGLVKGTVYAIDIEPSMVAMVERKAGDEGLNNVVAMLRDFVEEGTGLGDNSMDYVMLFNILHAERPECILKEAHRILKPGGRAGIIHWNYDPSTPRGPPMGIRPRPEQCVEWARASGFLFLERHDLKPYHYGLLFSKSY